MRSLLAASVLCCLMASSAFAELHVAGRGDSLHFNPVDFSPKMKANYEVFRVKCTRCHSQQRIVISFLSGRMPITGQPFDMDSEKTLAFRMYRKAMTRKDTIITKDEMRSIHALLKYMLEEAAR
jgi:hypothetical protein